MSHELLIKFCRAYDSRVLAGPVLGRGTVFMPGGLRFLPSQESVPLVVDHGREVGRVKRLDTIEWLDQRWNTASCELDDPPGWLRRGSGASFAYRTLHSYALNGWTVVTSAIVDEVTICVASTPVEPFAEVLSLHRSAAAAVAFAAAGNPPRPAVTHTAGRRRGSPYADEMQELRRRIDAAGGADVEWIITSMQQELNPGALRWQLEPLAGRAA